LAGPSPPCTYDDDRLRLPPASTPRSSKAGKKESTGHRLNRPCQPCATLSSNSSLGYHRSDARTAENGFATSSGVSKSAKVVLGSRLIKSTIQEQRRGRQRPGNFAPACRSGLRCA